SKVNGDLTIAHQHWARILENTAQQLTSVSESARLRDLLGEGGSSGSSLAAFLEERAQALRFDFLYVVGDDGRIIASARPMASPSPRSDWPVIRMAMDGRSRTDVDIFESEDLAAVSPELAGRARLELIPTRDAADTGRTEETRGMLIHSASPL